MCYEFPFVIVFSFSFEEGYYEYDQEEKGYEQEQVPSQPPPQSSSQRNNIAAQYQQQYNQSGSQVESNGAVNGLKR